MDPPRCAALPAWERCHRVLHRVHDPCGGLGRCGAVQGQDTNNSSVAMAPCTGRPQMATQMCCVTCCGRRRPRAFHSPDYACLAFVCRYWGALCQGTNTGICGRSALHWAATRSHQLCYVTCCGRDRPMAFHNPYPCFALCATVGVRRARAPTTISAVTAPGTARPQNSHTVVVLHDLLWPQGIHIPDD